MIFDRMREMDKLTNSEKVFVDYIIENNDAIVRFNINELAKACYVSASTIVRLAKKLGFDGYLQFKAQYCVEYSELEKINSYAKERPFNAKSKVEEVVNNLPYVYYKAVDYVKTAIDSNTIKRCMKYINKADIVMVFGNGLNKSIADMFVYKLSEVGKMAYAYDSVHYQQIDLYHNQKINCFAILLSHSANNPMILDSAERLSRIGVKKLIISSKETSDIHQYCEESLVIKKTISTLEFSNTIYSISTQYILDVFVALLIIESFNDIELSLENALNPLEE